MGKCANIKETKKGIWIWIKVHIANKKKQEANRNELERNEAK